MSEPNNIDTGGPADQPSPSEAELELAQVHLKDAIYQHIRALRPAIQQPDNLAPVAATSFAILAACSTFIATARPVDLLDAIELVAEIPHADFDYYGVTQSVFDFATLIIDYAAAELDVSYFSKSVPIFHQAIYQSVKQYIDRDPDLRLDEVVIRRWDIWNCIKDGRASDVAGSVDAFVDTILTAKSLTGPTVAQPHHLCFDAQLFYEPPPYEPASRETYPVPTFMHFSGTTEQEARLVRLGERRQRFVSGAVVGAHELAQIETAIAQCEWIIAAAVACDAGADGMQVAMREGAAST